MTRLDIYVENAGSISNIRVSGNAFIVLLVFQYCPDLAVNVVLVESTVQTGKENVGYSIDPKDFRFPITQMYDIDCPKMIQKCCLPAVQKFNEPWCISGLTGVLRHVLVETSKSEENHIATKLLGFRKGCLQACAEVSAWTKFCEIEVIKMMDNFAFQSCLYIPEEVMRYESHLSQPPILHNKLKKKQEVLKKESPSQYTALKQKGMNELPELEHNYAEGTDYSLADIILYCSFAMVLPHLEKSYDLPDICPKVRKWYNLITKESGSEYCDLIAKYSRSISKEGVEIKSSIPIVLEESLYKSDPSRYKPRWRAFTKQKDVEESMGRLSDISFSVENHRVLLPLDLEVCGVTRKTFHEHGLSCIKMERGIEFCVYSHDYFLDWSTFPSEVTLGHQLPTKRVERKSQQLENMALSVISIAKEGDVIVDFCAGSGHLGILLAHLLPHCKIMLVENKEASLLRAYERIQKLKLTNIEMYHCNLDYFKAPFDIGVSLHACGVATDLVMKKCLDRQASFVCSPCCYGSVQPNHILKYPRSDFFSNHLNMELSSYLVVGHAADQTQVGANPKSDQGKKCMQYIDYDRLSLAQESNYSTKLSVMEPSSCTPKNHILLGIHSHHHLFEER